MVEAYTIDGTVNLNIEPFQSAISSMNSELTTLGEGLNTSLNITDSLGSFDTLLEMFSELGVQAKEINQSFANFEGLNTLLDQLTQSREALIGAKEELANIKTEVSGVNAEMEKTAQITTQIATETTSWVAEIEKVTEGIVSLMSKEEWSNYILQNQQSEIGQINAKWRETQQLVQSNNQFLRELGATENNIAHYFVRENELLENSLQFLREKKRAEVSYSSEVTKGLRLLERQASEYERAINLTQQRARALGEIGRQIVREGSEIKKNLTYEEERLATEKLFQNALGEEMAYRMKLDAQIKATNESDMAIRKGVATNVKEILAMSDEQLAILREEVALEEQKLGVERQQTAEIGKQNAERTAGAKGYNGNRLDKMSYLPARIGSMAITMLGYQEIMDIYEKSVQNMNAIGQQKAYTDLMKTDNRYLTQTKQNVTDITNGVNKMNKAINETYKGGKSLQQMYQKVDMQSVSANAMDSAFKYGVQADKLDELTEVMAIYGSEFVRQGRSQEDSILAVNDALDGEYRRLKEVNIGKEELAEHGYKEGDTLSMIKALREIAEERGYDVVAQKVTNLSDAITVLEIRIAQDLVGAFKVLEPVLTEVANDFIYMLDTFEWAFSGVRDAWNKFTTELNKTFGVQNVQKFGGGLLKFVGWAITLGITFGIVYKVVSSLKGALGGLFGVLKKTESVGGEVTKSGEVLGESTKGDTFKDGFKGAKKNIGKIAKVVSEVAVAMFGAFVLIEEAMLLIAGIGATYDALKPQFDSGIQFIKDYGLLMVGIGSAFIVLSFAIDKIPDSAITSITKGATKLAYGMAIAMGLIAEAIVLLNAPLLAIASLGYVQEIAEQQINDGLAVIRMFANALHYIEQDNTIGWFIVGFVGLSAVLGFTADVVALPLAVGIATSLLLVAEAIVMLNVPLMAIASLGYVADSLGQESIQKGAEALKVVGQALKTIADAVPSLLIVDVGVLGQELMDWGSKLISGKDGLTYLSSEIIPNLSTFVQSFNSATIEQINTTTVENLSQVASQLPTIKSAIDTIRTTVGNGGTGGINVLGFQIGGDTSSLKPKLDILYQDIKDVIDFANKFGQSGSDGAMNSATAISQMATAVSQLQAKLNLMITTITTASPRVQSASKSLGSAIKVGFNEGSSGFNTSVVKVIADGVREVQSRYDTWSSAGKTSANMLAKGFDTIGGKLKDSISEEMGYALGELDNYKDDFYNKGAMLGDALVQGFKSRKALDQNSPAKITKSIREEMQYSMEALALGRQMMYNGGVGLGQALVNGYNSTGNIKTDVGVLASKGVSSDQIQANAKNIQLNSKGKQQVPQSFNPTFNIDMSNSTIIGIQDLDTRIQESIDKAIIRLHTPNGAIGY